MRVIKPYYEIEEIPDGDYVLQKLEKCARTCYKSEDKITSYSAAAFLQKLLSHDPPHMSVIEHGCITVRIVCDRGVSHELVRHRLVSYSQESTRYCNYSKGKFDGEITLIRPFFFPDDSEEYEVWRKACFAAEGAYMQLLKLGAKPQEARSVLPNSLKTEIVVTANLRQWGHIFKQRTAVGAHPQMREVMVPLLEDVRSRISVLYDNLNVYC